MTVQVESAPSTPLSETHPAHHAHFAADLSPSSTHDHEARGRSTYARNCSRPTSTRSTSTRSPSPHDPQYSAYLHQANRAFFPTFGTRSPSSSRPGSRAGSVHHGSASRPSSRPASVSGREGREAGSSRAASPETGGAPDQQAASTGAQAGANERGRVSGTVEVPALEGESVAGRKSLGRAEEPERSTSRARGLMRGLSDLMRGKSGSRTRE